MRSSSSRRLRGIKNATMEHPSSMYLLGRLWRWFLCFHSGRWGTWAWAADSNEMFWVQSARKALEDFLYESNKQGRGEISGCCADCLGVSESVVRTFLECHFAKAVWRKIPLWCSWDLTGLSDLDQSML